MNSWFGKKFQNQLKNPELTKTALSKLQQLGELKDVSKAAGYTPQQILSQRCPNCSTLSGLNNTVSVTLSQDLLNNTELNNVTTVEEICRDPGFQDFLSAQLNLYFKFIVNSSNNSILSSAKRRSVVDNGRSSDIPVPDPGTNMYRTYQYQNGTGCTTSQAESSRLLESQPDPALSLIEEEKSSEEQDVAVLCNQAQNHLKRRPVSDNTAKNNQSDRSQPSRLTQRLKDKLLQKVVDVPKPSLPVSSSACSTAETSEQLSRSGRKRSLRAAAIDTAEVVVAQSDEEVFKKPLPPKRKANPSRSNNNRNATTKQRAKKDESGLDELQQTHKSSVKAPIRQQQSLSRRVGSESSDTTTYRSRRGRVSKPPGNFWDAVSDDCLIPSKTKKTGSPSRGPRTKDIPKLSSVVLDKQSQGSEADIDSESGYSSVITARKQAQASKVTRTELLKEATEQSVSSKQASKNPRSRAAKPPTAKGTLNSMDAVENRVTDDQVSTDDTKKPTRGRPRRIASKDTVIENVASSAPLVKDAAAKPSRPAPAAKASASEPVQVAATRNIFSDSNSSSDDDSDEFLDADRNRRQRIDATQIPRQSRAAAPAVSKLLRETRKERVVVESSSDEEDAIVLVGKKKRPAVRNPRQTAVTKLKEQVPEESPLVSQKVPSRPKGRFIFSGSSTEEESVCSYRTSDGRAKHAESESFEDDASYVSSTRSNRRKEILPEGNKNGRQAAVVSRFRIQK